MILFMLAFLGFYGYVDFCQSEGRSVISLGWIFILPVCEIGIDVLIGRLMGDEWYNTGYVSNGRSVYNVKKTPKYYSRRMFFCFIECFLFVLLIIRYVFLFSASIIVPTLGIICSIIAIIIYFIVGMSSYEKSSIKHKWNLNKENKTHKTISQKKEQNKFKFNKFPQLLEKYNQFKICNSKKYKSCENTKNISISKEINESLGLINIQRL